MIFCFHDNGHLAIFANPESVYRQYDGLDVESGAIMFFNEAQIPMYACFSSPNRYGRTLGITWSSAGSYTLKIDHLNSQMTFQEALEKTVHLVPNPFFPSFHMLANTAHTMRIFQPRSNLAA